MTCIVGVAEDGNVYMGSDYALTSYGGRDSSISELKIFRNGPFIIGVAGSMRVQQLTKYVFKPPAPPEDDALLMEYMVTKFVSRLGDVVHEAKIAPKPSDFLNGSRLLVGYSGRLFQIECDLTVLETNRYAAVGSRDDVALGALYASRASSPRDRISEALYVAARSWSAARSTSDYISSAT